VGIVSENFLFLFLKFLRASAGMVALSCAWINGCDEDWISGCFGSAVHESPATGAGISETFNLVIAAGSYEFS
jgi:hypothetical protein